jgi:hypothetical protein
MMERIFIERYGPPTAQEQKSVQNRMGAQYVNEHRYWTGLTMTITLRRYGTKLTEGWAIYSPSSAIQDLQKQTEDAANLTYSRRDARHESHGPGRRHDPI